MPRGRAFARRRSVRDGPGSPIVAVVSWGDEICQAKMWNYRLDTTSAGDFLDDFVTIP